MHIGCCFFPRWREASINLIPKLFTQNHQEQIETMAHELGHIFGLRHFFAEIKEKSFPSIKFGKHQPFSIMNYGHKSKMTQNDRNDLRKLYEKVWSGELKEINGTRIVIFSPYHTIGGVE